MHPLKIAGVVVASLAAVGGGIWLWRRHKSKQDAKPERVPTRPPPPTAPEDDIYDQPDMRPSRAHETMPTGHVVERTDLDRELAKAVDIRFGEGQWPPDEQTINKLEQDQVIVFAVESDEIGNYTETRQELITAKVLSVEKSYVRARIFGKVKQAEHHGSFAGHGYRIGDLLELPRWQILVAAERNDPDATGYGSQGSPALTLEPSSITKQLYTVKAGTPYDLVMPYPAPHLTWHVDRELVRMMRVGEHKLRHQIMFTEDSLRGEVSIRALDEDPEAGTHFMGRWDFALES